MDIVIDRGKEALALARRVLCESEGGGDWRLARFLSVNGLLTRKRCVLWFSCDFVAVLSFALGQSFRTNDNNKPRV